MNFEEAEANLNRRVVMPTRTPSLEPMKEALQRIAIRWPTDLRRVILVAGTNGKGSVSKILEGLLLHQKQTVGLYTSPHLSSITERIRINGQDLEKSTFLKAFEELEQLVADIGLSHFEMLTLMACWCFFNQPGNNPVDWAVFEVGMGGTWDATNALPHQTAAVTTIGRDHTHILGNSLEEIADNKFGIGHSQCDVICGALPEVLKPWVEERQLGFRSITTMGPHKSYFEPGNPPQFYLESKWGNSELKLPGARAAENANLALTIFEKLGFQPKNGLVTLSKIEWPGRMSQHHFVDAPCPVYLSGDHNIDGIYSLLELLPAYHREKIHFLVSVGQKKQPDEILETLLKVPNSSINLTVSPFMGRPLSEYGSWLASSQEHHTDPKTALHRVFKKANPQDLIVVTGSLYLVGHLLSQ